MADIYQSPALVANADSPLYDQAYPDGDRGASLDSNIWTAITDYDHNRPGILQFRGSREIISEPGTVRVYVERVGGYSGAVGCTLSSLSTTGDGAMTEDTHFNAVSQAITFDDQEAGVKYVDVVVTNSPGNGLHYFVLTLSSPTGGAELRNPEMHIYFDDGGVNPNATVITSGSNFESTFNSSAAGSIIYLRDGAAYTNNNRPSGQAVGGYHLTGSGTQTARKFLCAYPGETPVIDQDYQQTHDLGGNRIVAGLTITASHITIKGLEIHSCLSSGILFIDGGTKDNVVIEDCNIHDVGNPPNGISDYNQISNADNLGAIRIDDTIRVCIRNNTLHHIYDARTTSNNVGEDNLNLHSGVHGYRAEGAWIHNNTIHYVNKGVYAKHPNQNGELGHRVHNNLFYDIGQYAFVQEVAGGGSEGVRDIAYYNNLAVLDYYSTDEAKSVQINMPGIVSESTSPWIYGNTQIGGGLFSYVRSARGVVFFNNISDGGHSPIAIDGRDEDFAITEEIPSTSIDYCDFNNWTNMQSFVFTTSRNLDSNQYAGLAAWRSAYPADIQINNDVGENSISEAPTYVDSGSGDYRNINGAGFDAGRFGRTIGIGAEICGAM